MANQIGMSAIISHPGAPSIAEQIGVYAAVGFESFFLSCGVTEEFFRIPEWAAVARRVGVCFEAVHGPSDGVDALWVPEETDGARAYLARAERLIDLCAEGGVGRLVLHVGGAEPVSAAGLARFAALEAFATDRGVSLCYENAGSAAHLFAVVESASPGHGFCHDAGHEQCYTPDADYLTRLGPRLLYTHIHDNLGKADNHFLPYDGILDWDAYATRIAEIGYTGTLNLELACIYSEQYRAWSFERFAGEAYTRARRLADAVETAEKRAHT